MSDEKKKRHKVKWELIEPDFRSGVKSPQQICSEYEQATGHKVSRTGINKHFEKLGIKRDLAAKVQAKANSLVAIATVAARVAPETTLTDAVIIEESAQVVAGIRLSQRRDLSKAMRLVMALFDELDLVTSNVDLFEQLGDILRAPDERGLDKLNDIYKKVIAITGRVDSVKKLSDAFKTLVGIQNEAYNIKPETPDEPSAGRSGAKAPVVLPDYILAMIPVQPQK